MPTIEHWIADESESTQCRAPCGERIDITPGFQLIIRQREMLHTKGLPDHGTRYFADFISRQNNTLQS